MSRPRALQLAMTVAAIAIVASVAFAASPALAAKGGPSAGRGGGKGGHQTPPAATVTVTVAPNPVPAGSGFTVTFSGLVSGHAYNVYAGAAVYWLSGDGTVTWSYAAGMWQPGTYTFTVYDITGGGFVNVGSATFQVL